MSEEIQGLLEKTRNLSPEKIYQEGIYQDAANWVTTTLPDRINQNYPVESKSQVLEAADIQGDLTQVLMLYKNTTIQHEETRKAMKMLLFEGKVATAAGPQNRQEVINSMLYGPISTLTTLHLLQESDRMRDTNNYSRLNIDQIIPSAEDDAYGKIDLELDWGPDHPLCLVQIKTTPNNVANVHEVHEGVAHLNDMLGMNSTQMNAILERADLIAQERGLTDKKIKCFVISVPNADTQAVNQDPYGEINSQSMRTEVVEGFLIDAQEHGLLPES